MAIYGTALLAACLLVGLVIGQLIGLAMGINKNVGGVGIAMLLLIAACGGLQRHGRLLPSTERGIVYWSAIYIPIVVAMAASQNVIAAVQGGPVAIVAGVLVVVISFACVPFLSRIGQGDTAMLDQPFDSNTATTSTTSRDAADENPTANDESIT